MDAVDNRNFFFAPASPLAVVRSVLALVMSKGLEVVTIDIQDAYLPDSPWL